ncbi:MAG: radical SAM protein [Lachnospiraceae bacterium]|nr:radical SAM protein [Lachnospiraceae bacterium]
MKKVIVFGMGGDCKKMLEEQPSILDNVIAFTSNNATEKEMMGKPVIKPSEIKDYPYNAVVIATNNYLLQIFRQCCQELHIPMDKVLSVNEYMKEAIVDGGILPKKIRLDSSTLCQLDCPGCYMRLHEHPAVGDGYLKFSDFKRLLDENTGLAEIELSNNGEPFLNPDMKAILEYAAEKGVSITFRNGTNFNNVSEDVIETLVRTKVKFINFSIDGASQEVYSMYRRGGDFGKVMENIKLVNFYKNKYASECPVLQWQFILMEHNQHQVLEAKHMAEELNMKIYYKLDATRDYEFQDPEFIKEVTGLKYLSEGEVLEKTGKFYNMSCRELFDFPAINFDGKLVGCCRVSAYAEKEFGANVFRDGLRGALSSEEYMRAKKVLLGESAEELPDTTPCGSCYVYKNMKKTGNYLRREDIRVWKGQY